MRSGNRGYGEAGASRVRRALKGFVAESASAIEDIDANNYTLRQRARMLYMSAPVATSAIRTSRTNVVGVGLQLNPKIDLSVLGMTAEAAEEWQRDVKAEFSLWADDKAACDATGMNDFYAIQQLAFASMLTSGDCFVLRQEGEPTRMRPYGLRLRVIEADRVSSPAMSARSSTLWTEGENPRNGNKIHDGVEVDKAGMVVAYHICNHYPFSLVSGGEADEWVRVKAYGDNTGLPNVLHLMSSERPEQYRGVSYLAQIIEPILQMRRYTDAEVMAAVIQSFYTAFIKTEAPATDIPFNEAMPGDGGGSEAYDPTEYRMGPGQVNVMNPGEDVEALSPTHPNSKFDEFVKAICTQVGAALEIPRDLLLKEFNASYSASRAAMLEAWKSFRMYRSWFASDFCQPAYELWLSEAVARGRVNAPGFFEDPKARKAWLRAEWVGPSQGQLDPVKEITAEIMAAKAGFTTSTDATIRLNGSDWLANMDQIERELAKTSAVMPQESEVDAQ